VAPPPKVKKVKPNHKGKLLLLTLPNGQTRFITSAEAAMRMGQSKGGYATAVSGKARPLFTSETATRVNHTRWRKWGRMNHRIGRRLGIPSKRAKKVMRAPLRIMYEHKPVKGIYYVGYVAGKHSWREIGPDGGDRPLKESTALMKLGYLPRRSGIIPTLATLAPLMRTPRGTKKKENV
jgi:hypothetical protein